jgi:predicted MFS family arabinose efflux permease
MARHASERAILFCLGAVQFVNVLDFMMVMPLGPDFAKDLGIPLSHLGYIGGAYTASASVAGIAGAFFLDRFDRRQALVVALLGLFVGTLAGAASTGLYSLVAARVLAGMFGGPATSLSYSIIADVVPNERRGRAMGAVMGAFAISSVFGVPAGLELARHGGWRTPFVAVAILGAVVAGLAYRALPPIRAHLARVRPRETWKETRALFRSDIGGALLLTFVQMMASFVVVPNISSYVQDNLGYPRDRLGLLYMVGGSVSFVAMRFVGRLVDRFGSAPMGTFGAILMSTVTWAGFAVYPPLIGVLPLFCAFMLGVAFRSVPFNTLATKVPRPDERARFSSIQSAVQHLAAAIGAFTAAQMLTERPGGGLEHMPRVAWLSMFLAMAAVPLFWLVERRVHRAASEADAGHAMRAP